jgi:hypothetical protein
LQTQKEKVYFGKINNRPTFVKGEHAERGEIMEEERQKEKGNLRDKTFAQSVPRSKKLRYPRHMDMNLNKRGEFSPKYRPLQPRRMWTAEDKRFLQTGRIETPANKENRDTCRQGE